MPRKTAIGIAQPQSLLADGVAAGIVREHGKTMIFRLCGLENVAGGMWLGARLQKCSEFDVSGTSPISQAFLPPRALSPVFAQ